MKYLKFVIVALLAFSYSCTRKNCVTFEKKNNLTERIQYQVPIKTPDASFDWWVQNIEGAEREKMVQKIFDLALNGKIKAYNSFNELLTIDQIRAKLNGIDTSYAEKKLPPYGDSIIVTKMPVKAHQITSISFIESWFFNSKSGLIEKKVLGYAPLLEKHTSEGEFIGYAPLFWIYFDEKYPQ